MNRVALLSYHGYFVSKNGGGISIDRRNHELQEQILKLELPVSYFGDKFNRFIDNSSPIEFSVELPNLGRCDLQVASFSNVALITSGGCYLSAQPSGELIANRLKPHIWEQFIIVPESSINHLCFILSNRWIIASSRTLINSDEIKISAGPNLLVGEISIPLKWNIPIEDHFFPNRIRVKIDGWRFEQIILFKPIVYFAAFGDDAIEQLSLCLWSLFYIGNFHGDVILFTEKSEKELFEILGFEILARIRVVIKRATDWVGFVSSRFAILEEDIAWSCSPVVYFDPDIIFNKDIQDMMIDMACAKAPCAAHEHFSKLASSPSVGAELLSLDNERPELACGFNAGTIALPNLKEFADVFSLIRDTVVNLSAIYGRGFHKWVDQEVANYISYKHARFDTVAMTKHMRYGWMKDSTTLGTLSGFIHFCGINRLHRISPMRNYLNLLANYYNIKYKSPVVTGNKNLIIARCGPNSLHKRWLEGKRRNWDLWLCPYEEIESSEHFTVTIPGWKFHAMHILLNDHKVWRDYRFISFVDEDVLATSDTWSEFFDRCHSHDVKLASPALTPESYYTHLFTMQNRSFTARMTTFVEIMCPCMSREFLEEALPTMLYQRLGAGFGLDFVWPFMLKYKDIWIFDDVPVCHTRPVGGTYSDYFKESLNYDLRLIAGLGVPWEVGNVGGVLPSGDFIKFDEPRFSELLREGYSYIAEFHPSRKNEVVTFSSGRNIVHSIEIMARLKAAVAHISKPNRTISRGMPASVSSLSKWSWSNNPEREASGGNDGLLNGMFGFHTEKELSPWWQVDFGKERSISLIIIYNRLDQKDRFTDFDVSTSLNSVDWNIVFSKRDGKTFGGLDGDAFKIKLQPSVTGRFMRLTAHGFTYLHLDQIEVFECSDLDGFDH